MEGHVVAIVGRPNVGKSTLFNRLVGRRQAIVEDIPGTTRDRVYADVRWGDQSLVLIDTGGMEPNPGSDIARRVRAQVQLAVEEAEVIIFMVDVRDGATVTDLDIAEALRRSGKPVVLAVNKADNERRHADVAQFYELAMGDPIPVSAYHGTGIGDLMSAVVLPMSPMPPREEEALLRTAIVGRPNVGKSMLLNAILGEDRVIVSETPGTTRDTIDTTFEYSGESMVLVDTAGIRRRGRIEGGVEQYSVLRAMQAVSRADVALLVLDAGELVTAQDTHIAGYIVQACKGVVVVVNKWDLVRDLGLDAGKCAEEIRYKLKFISYAPIVYVSALLGE
ncbi:MAG: ribosome biogenesis GTPase Der, partial [Chloroflexota bacterium]